MNTCTDIHFGDPLTFPLVLPAGQSFHLFSEISLHLPDGLTQNFKEIFIFILISLSRTLCLVLISKCKHANMKN